MVAPPALTLVAPSVLVTLISATGWTLLESEGVLLPGVGSVTPGGGVTVAVLTSGLGASPATVPVTVKVTEPVFGRLGITMPAPCIKATVVLATTGQTAPLIGVPQVTLETFKPVMTGSVNTALSAVLGPLFVTAMV